MRPTRGLRHENLWDSGITQSIAGSNKLILKGLISFPFKADVLGPNCLVSNGVARPDGWEMLTPPLVDGMALLAFTPPQQCSRTLDLSHHHQLRTPIHTIFRAIHVLGIIISFAVSILDILRIPVSHRWPASGCRWPTIMS